LFSQIDSITVLAHIIYGIRYILKLISLQYVFSVHQLHEFWEDGGKVRIEETLALQGSRVDKKVLHWAHEQSRDQMVLIGMLDAAINEGFQVLLCIEDEVGNKLWDLVVDKSHCLSNSGHRVIYEFQEVQELFAYHIHDILGLGTVDDSTKGDHWEIAITPVLTVQLWANVGVHCVDHICSDSPRNIFESVSSRNGDVVLGHLIETLIIGFGIKLVQTCDDYMEHTLIATLDDSLRGLIFHL
jgi:hypothetical protein